MPRPRDKESLLTLSHENFEKLNTLVDSFSAEDQLAEFPKGTMNRNIRDVLAHLHHWHLMMMGWYEIGMAGEKPDMPATGYTWRTVPDLNRMIWEKYNTYNLDEVRGLFNSSHQSVYELIKRHSNEELFQKKRYPWTGSTSLGAYLVSATSSHYDWALKLIRKAKK